jgi:hypothetical protein
MAKSTKQLQDEIVNDGFLDSLGDDSTDYAGMGEFPSVEQFMIRSAAAFVLQIKEVLNRQGKVSSGGLEDGISSGSLNNTGNGYQISIGWDSSDPASKYYDFVNKGVKGVVSGNPSSSPYAFRNLKVSRNMQRSILLWYRKRGNAARNEDQKNTKKNPLSATQRKNRSIKRQVDAATRLKSMAYATAVNIKKKGIKRSGFFDNTINSVFGQSFLDALSKVVGQDVKIAIRQANNKINENK